jgi:uncharacterized protein
MSDNTPAKPRNKGGRPRKTAKRDGWSNVLSGFGTSRDRRSADTFCLNVVSYQDAIDRWRGDDIGARLVETWPDEMLRRGYEITVARDDLDDEADDAGRPGRVDAADDEEDDAPIQQQVMKVLEELGADWAFRTALCYRRAYGGGAVFMGVNDGVTDLTQPLDPDRVTSVDFLTTLEARECIPLYWYSDPLGPKFGMPAIYQVQTITPGVPYDGTANPGAIVRLVHESRMIIFTGPRVTRVQLMGSTAGWGDNVFTRVDRVLSDFQMTWASAATLIADFSQAVFKVKGLAASMASDGDDYLKKRIQATDIMRSVMRAVMVDAEGEDFERKATSVTGLPELLDRFMSRLAAAADMPLTLLMGESPGGLNATGDSDVRFFYDRVASAQQRDLRPAIMRLARLVFNSLGGEPAQWGVRFNPLWSPTEKETADARYVQAQADALYISNDVLSADEVALSRFGGDQYSFETQVDFKRRANLEVAAPKPVAKEGEDPDEAVDPNTLLTHAKAAALTGALDTPDSSTLKADDVRLDFVRKRGKKWVVLSHEGKVLGTHATRAEAVAQLGAIEAAKARRG